MAGQIVAPLPTGGEHRVVAGAVAGVVSVPGAVRPAGPEAGGRSGQPGGAVGAPLGNTGTCRAIAGQSVVEGASELGWEVEEEPTSADLRWALHTGVEWRHNPLKKVRACRRYASDEGSNEIGVTFAPCKGEGGVEVGVNRVKTCGSWHSCLPCGARIAVHRARELAQAFETWETLGNSVVLATFTLQHHAGQSLRDLLVAQRAGWQALRSKRPYEADLLNLGVASFPIESALGTRMVKGVIRAFESTYGDDHGWHPHYHVFFLVEGVISAEAAREAVAPMWDRWVAGLAKHGATAIATVNGESAGLDVKVIGSGQAASYGKYPFKLALEAVGGSLSTAAPRTGRAVRSVTGIGRRRRSSSTSRSPRSRASSVMSRRRLICGSGGSGARPRRTWGCARPRSRCGPGSPTRPVSWASRAP